MKVTAVRAIFFSADFTAENPKSGKSVVATPAGLLKEELTIPISNTNLRHSRSQVFISSTVTQD
jgi:hypothetical protein